MKDEKSYGETERIREQSELGRKEEKIVNCVDISDNQKVFIKFSTVTYRNLLKWVIFGVISGILLLFSSGDAWSDSFSILLFFDIDDDIV